MKNPFHLYTKVTIYLGTNEIIEAKRAVWDWLNEGWTAMLFHLPDGRRMKVQKHWIIRIVEGWLTPEDRARIAVEKAKREEECNLESR